MYAKTLVHHLVHLAYAAMPDATDDSIHSFVFIRGKGVWL